MELFLSVLLALLVSSVLVLIALRVNPISYWREKRERNKLEFEKQSQRRSDGLESQPLREGAEKNRQLSILHRSERQAELRLRGLEIVDPWRYNTRNLDEKCQGFRKVIEHFNEIEYEFCPSVEFDIVNFSGKWGVINDDNDIIVTTQYDYVDFFRNESHFKIAVGNIKIDDDPSRTICTGLKWGVINNNSEILLPPQYDWIQEVENDIYLVNLGCRMKYDSEYNENDWYAEGGVWGIVNSRNETLIPIEYDSYTFNWGSVKQLIFMQKGKSYFEVDQPYDGYDFKGNLIYNNVRGKISENYQADPF